VPAPAVIPAPKAYINAVAVKGFVVELGVVKETTGSCDLRVHEIRSLLQLENIRNKHHGSGIPPITHATHVGGTPVIFTVTKEARLKQSNDMN
jgi:hypothetical protein